MTGEQALASSARPFGGVGGSHVEALSTRAGLLNPTIYGHVLIMPTRSACA
jgi:hypothetical protein